MLRKFLTSLLAVVLISCGAFPASAENPFKVTFETNDTSGFIHIDFDDDVQLPGHQLSSVVTGIDGNSSKVLKVVRGTASWAGTTFIKDANKTLLKAGSLFVKASIHSPVAGQKLMMKIENKNDVTQSVESYATQDSIVGWNEYTFDFSKERTGTEAFSTNKTYNMASVYFGFTMSANPPTAGLTYYLDDVTFASATGGSGGTVLTPTAKLTLLTYEANDANGALGAFEASPVHPVGIFGGGTAAIVTDTLGMGSSANKVLALTKSGAQFTGYNAIIDTDGSLRITTAESPVVSFKYFSAKDNSPVALQLFSGDSMQVQMLQNANIGLNSMTFDFSTASGWSASKVYTKLVIFPDFQVATTTPPDVYYFDDVAINGATTDNISVKPSNLLAAALTNRSLKVGNTLTAAKGTWSSSVSVTYKYAWYRCTAKSTSASSKAPVKSNKCSLISNQKSDKYKLTRSDKGKYIRLLVTATKLIWLVAQPKQNQ